MAASSNTLREKAQVWSICCRVTYSYRMVYQTLNCGGTISGTSMRLNQLPISTMS